MKVLSSREDSSFKLVEVQENSENLETKKHVMYPS